ncbi:GNAT family N-acetyltransferase [Actinacidiphila sp. bgisy144]|uniref:GNAT family N-acetyltransferase n=1 Tax=Actinacidiphila sp. bgisy144 TaxID=3413791 RepID=UPI003EBB184C
MTNVITGAASSTPSPGPGPGPALRWRVEAVRPQDGPVLDGLFARCSAETVRLRFFGRLRELPRSYLDAVLAGRPERHDAVIAYPQGPFPPDSPSAYSSCPAPVGLGSLATEWADGPGAAPYPCPLGELGLLVVDGWQRRGAGAAMLDVLFDRARARGTRLVSASVLPGRQALLGTLGRRLRPVRMSRATDTLTGVYRLDPAEWTEAGDGGSGHGERGGHGGRGEPG